MLLYLAGGNDGLNIVLPNGAGDDCAANYAAYSNARQDIGRGVGPSRRGRPGRLVAAARPGRRRSSRSPTRRSPPRGGGDNGDAAYGFDTLYGDGTGGAGSDLAVMPAVDAKKYIAQPLRQLRHLVRGQLRPQQQDGLARPLDRPQRQPRQPAAGDLDRHRAVEVDPHRRSTRCARSPSLPMTGFKLNGASTRRRQQHDRPQHDRCSTLAGVPAGAGNAYLARSRGTYGLAYSTVLARSDAYGALPPDTRPATRTTNTLSTRLRTAAHLLKSHLGTRIITIHWGGFDTHTRPAHDPGHAVQGALARARPPSRRTCRPAASTTASRTLVFSEFGRRVKETPNTARPPTTPAPTTARAA